MISTLWKDVESPPKIILVGHSMGGAIAVHVAASGAIKNLAGLVVIDVVEGLNQFYKKTRAYKSP